MVSLLVFCLAQLVLAVLQTLYSLDLKDLAILDVLMQAVKESQGLDLKLVKDQLGYLGASLTTFTVISLLCGCCALGTAKYIPNFCCGIIGKVFTCCSFIFFVSIGSTWIVLGGVFLLPQIIVANVDDHCKWSAEGQWDKMVYMDQDYSELFKTIHDIDE